MHLVLIAAITALTLAAVIAIFLSSTTGPALPIPLSTHNGYYVSPSGSDTNAGSLASPWKTVQHAVNSVSPGDTIFLRAGTYPEHITISISGAAGSPITLTNYPGEAATINGGSATAITTSGAVSYWTIQGLSITSTNRYTLQLGWWGGSFNTNWIVKANHLYGSSITKGTNQLFDSNDVSGIYPDGSKYGAFSGQGNGDAGLMDIDGSNHDTFSNNLIHDFSNSDARGIWTQGYTHDDLIQNNTVSNILPTGGIGQSIDLDGAGTVEWNHTVRGNHVSGNNHVGIQLENAFASLIEDNTIQDTGSAGIILINYDSSVGCPAVGTRGSPYGDSNGNGSCKDELSNDTISQNLVTKSGNWGWGYGGIMNWGVRAASLIANTVYSASSSGSAAINYQDQASYSDGAVVRGNILASGNGPAVCSLGGFSIFSQDDHNLLYNAAGSNVYATGSGCSGAYSLSAYQSATGKGSGSIQANPLFVTTGSNFHLQATSPAIDKSVNLGLSSDLDGTPRPQGAGYDIGAYEYASK